MGTTQDGKGYRGVVSEVDDYGQERSQQCLGRGLSHGTDLNKNELIKVEPFSVFEDVLHVVKISNSVLSLWRAFLCPYHRFYKNGFYGEDLLGIKI